MSSQKGNSQRTRGQKYQNKTAFKNSMHDTSKKTQQINSMLVSGVCKHCKDVIDWKIKYKKYKPLTQPKKCTKCHEKTVKKAYYIMCVPCSKRFKLCAKCGQGEEIIHEPEPSPSEEAKQQAELEQELKLLPERKRKTYYRLQQSGKLTEDKRQELLKDLDMGDDFDDDFLDGEDNDSDVDNNSDNDGSDIGAAKT